MAKNNPVYEFEYHINKSPIIIRFTSVSGHFKNFKFPDSNKQWDLETIKNLFDISLEKVTCPQSTYLVKNLHILIKDADTLFLWLDCDREGEAIAFDVIETCKEIKQDFQIF